MILNVMIFKNHVLDCFTTPNFIDGDAAKAGVQLARSIKLGLDSNDVKVLNYRTLELFHFGTFDDETGKISFFEEPISVLDCRTLFPKAVVEADAKAN